MIITKCLFLKMLQKTLLKNLQEIIPRNTSLIEAVAIALEISYDAAHRRVSLKSKFSFEESVQLANYYHLSLDKLKQHLSNEYIAVEKTKSIKNQEGLQKYFENSYDSLLPLLKQKESQIIYSAKDIPLFYNLSGDALSTFKMYTWLKLIDPKFKSQSFHSFVPSVSLIQSSKRLGQLYKNLQITEIWDITTVNSTLKQIHYYHLSHQLSIEKALVLIDNLKEIISQISTNINNTNSNYLMYYNELHLMNNNVLVKTPALQSLYVPFTLLSYYKTNDRETCKEADDFLQRQLQSSKLLNTSGEKDRSSFFNKIYRKIEALEKLIRANSVLDFE